MIAATATVAIPTRNRRARLIPLLERLIPQAADVGADILVVDNGSSDGRAFWTGWGEGFIDARRVDRSLYEEYRTRGLSPPRWLEEHMRNGLPDERVVEGLPGAWKVSTCGNESVRFHE